MKRKLLYCIILLLLCFVAKAADFYISSSTGLNTNPGTQLAPWHDVNKYVAGNRYFFLCGDTFYNMNLPNLNTTPSTRIFIGKYGFGASPVFSGFCTINSSAWSLYSPGVWVATITNSFYVTGTIPKRSNCGMIVVGGVKSGFRTGVITGLNKQWEFYCDFADKIYVYSTSNPSLLSNWIMVSTEGRPVYTSNYITIEYIRMAGWASPPIAPIRPLVDTFRHCFIENCGGEMKSLLDTLRQGAGIAYANGATSCMNYYDSIKNVYECALTWQLHSGGGPNIPFTDCMDRKCWTDSCESFFNPSVAVVNAHGFIRCRVDSCTTQRNGYSWSHFAKPSDNQAVCLLNNFWLQVSTERDIIVEHNTFICPREGLYFFSGNATDPRFVTRNNDIYIDSNVLLRKNFNGKPTPYTYTLATHTQFTTDLGYEVNSTWHLCGDIIVIPPTTQTFYRDDDGDSWGDPNVSITSTNTTEPGYVLDNSDCDDTNPLVHPDAAELLDGIDNNCDGIIDNLYVYYHDADGDGYGNPLDSIVVSCPDPPVGYVQDNTDCNDTDPNIFPLQREIANGIDDNCNGVIDEGCIRKRVSATP